MRTAIAFWMRHRAEGIWLVVVVAMATAVTTAVWSIANGVWFDRPPFEDPDRLVSIGWTVDGKAERTADTSIEESQDIKRAAADVVDVAGWESSYLWFLQLGAEPVQVAGAAATTNLFDVLGVQPLIGRTFLPDDSLANGSIAVISHRLWVTAFNSDPSIVGRLVTVSVPPRSESQTVHVVGVLPAQGSVRRFDKREVDLVVAVPDGLRPGGAQSRRIYNRSVVARLRSGVSLEQAEARLTPLLREIDRTTGLFQRTRTASLVHLHDFWFASNRPFILLLAAAAVFLLLVAGANGAGVMLALASRRTREMAVRTAIGAGRRHLLQQALRETLAIAAPATVIGVGAAAAIVRGFVVFGPAHIPRLAEVSLDWRAVAVAASIAIGFCLVLATLPLLTRGRDILALLQSGSVSTTASRRTLFVRRAAIAIQLSVVLALLASAGLVSVTLWRMLSQPLGFDPDHVVVARIMPTKPYFTDADTYFRVRDDLRRSVASLSQVESSALVFDPPLADYVSRIQVRFADQPARFVATKEVSDGFLSTMKIAVIAGRDLRPADALTSDAVLVNELFAQRFFGSVDRAVGQEIERAVRQRIVGVVSNVREGGLTQALVPTVYPVQSARFTPGSFHIIARVRGRERNALRDVEAAILKADPSMNVEMSLLNDRVAAQTAVARTQSAAIGLIAVCSLVLAGLGIYATIAQIVHDRQREMAIRSALGASARSLIILTSSGLAISVAIGVIGGGLLSFIVASVTRQFLFEMSPFDPTVWMVSATVIVLTATAATLWPARRAGGVDPAVILRQS